MSNKNTLTLSYPASWWAGRWREALPAGNGAIGAAVYGSIDEETIMLTHEDLWTNRSQQELPDVSAHLPEVRRRLLANQIAESQQVLSDALRAQGYRQTCAYPVPLGDVKLSMPAVHAFKDYSRALDMGTGEITVSWRDGEVSYERVLFVLPDRRCRGLRDPDECARVDTLRHRPRPTRPNRCDEAVWVAGGRPTDGGRDQSRRRDYPVRGAQRGWD